LSYRHHKAASESIASQTFASHSQCNVYLFPSLLLSCTSSVCHSTNRYQCIGIPFLSPSNYDVRWVLAEHALNRVDPFVANGRSIFSNGTSLSLIYKPLQGVMNWHQFLLVGGKVEALSRENVTNQWGSHRRVGICRKCDADCIGELQGEGRFVPHVYDDIIWYVLDCSGEAVIGSLPNCNFSVDFVSLLLENLQLEFESSLSVF